MTLKSSIKKQLKLGEEMLNVAGATLNETKQRRTAERSKARAYVQVKHMLAKSSTLCKYFKLRGKHTPLTTWWM